MGDAADPRRASSAMSRSWQLILAPWSEAQRAALRRFGNDESSVVLFALRTDGGKLEVFVTCKAPCRAAWLSTHVIEGEWRPAASPKTKGERCNLLAQYQECCDRSNQGQRANVPASAASPARPPKDREGLQAARPPEDREDLGLPPLAADSIEPRQLAPAPSPASMFSLSPAQRTAAESAAAERAAKRAAKARRAERQERMFEEYQRAMDFEHIRGSAEYSAAWRRICDPSDDEGMMPCPEACGAVWEEEGEAEDETADRPAATSSSSGWLSGYTLSRKYGRGAFKTARESPEIDGIAVSATGPIHCATADVTATATATAANGATAAKVATAANAAETSEDEWAERWRIDKLRALHGSMIDGNAGYATRQSRRSFGAKMSRANFIERYTVKLIEQDSRVNNHFRWCAYTGMFKSKELFAPQQLLARAELRFCEDFASSALRASKTPGLTMNAQAIAWAAATLNITLTDDEGEVGGAAIGPGAGSRDEHANEHAGPQVPEEFAS